MNMNTERIEGYKELFKGYLNAFDAPKLEVDDFVSKVVNLSSGAVEKPGQILRELTPEEMELLYLDISCQFAAEHMLEQLNQSVKTKSLSPCDIPLIGMIAGYEKFAGCLVALVLTMCDIEGREQEKLKLDETVCIVLEDNALHVASGRMVEKLRDYKLANASEKEAVKFMLDKIIADFDNDKINPTHSA